MIAKEYSMKRDPLEKWITALRSGEYVKGYQVLKNIINDIPCYCAFESRYFDKDDHSDVKKRVEAYGQAIKPLVKLDSEFYLQAFDDHVQVFVTRDGVIVEEYDHD